MKTGVYRYQQNSRIGRENMDKKSREELILEYAPLVKKIVDRIAIRLPPNVSKDELVIGAGKGSLAVLEIQPPGKKAMAVRSYLQGKKLRKGMKFGSQ